jgi:hypothetical protein
MNTCIKCGCDDAYPSLPPCPSPTACPNPPECAEVYPAECVVLSLANITCGVDVVVFQGDSLVGALENIVNYFCQRLVTLTNFINAQLSIINGRLTTIEGDIIDIKGDISTIQGDIVDIKGDIVTIQGDVSDLDARVTNNEGDIINLQTDVSTLTTNVGDLTACCDTKQKFISGDYTITNNDDNYSIIITNGGNPINITVPTGLSPKLQVGFIQDGTGDVSFVASGTTIYNAISGFKSKGQYYQTYLEQGATPSIYYLLGNTKV